jgi:hypothetical protein
MPTFRVKTRLQKQTEKEKERKKKKRRKRRLTQNQIPHSEKEALPNCEVTRNSSDFQKEKNHGAEEAQIHTSLPEPM